MSISLKPEPIEYIGKLETFEQVTGNYGEQIKIQMKPANPEAVTYKYFFFPFNKTGNSKLNKFTRSFGKCLGKPADDSDLFLGIWVRVQEIPYTWEDAEGVTHDGKDYLVAEIYKDETMAMAAWKAKKPAEKPEEVPYSPPDTPAAPAPAVVALPTAIVDVLKKQYETVGKNKEALWAVVSAWGYTKEQVMAAVS